MLFVQARARAHEEDEKDEQDRTTESDRARERLYERETESSVGRGEKEASGKSTRWHSQDRLELYSLSLLLAFSLTLSVYSGEKRLSSLGLNPRGHSSLIRVGGETLNPPHRAAPAAAAATSFISLRMIPV